MRIYDLKRNRKGINKIKKRSTTDLAEVIEKVKTIVYDVKNRGDEAVIEYTKKFDRIELKKLRVTKKEKKEAYSSLKKDEIRAIKNAAKNIRKFCELEKPKAWFKDISTGIKIGQLIRPIERVGVYVPGGRFPLPSCTLTSVIPAKIAGVEKIFVCTPPKEGGIANEAIVVAADIAGANEVFKVGGAQAIAAMAFGTKTIPRVNKIVGPGNIYVTAAKKLIFGDVGIDFLAGPTEILIIADDSANPRYIVADMLAQAEHDILASALLVTNSKELGEKVIEELKKQLRKLTTADIARESLEKYGGVILVNDLDQAFEFANEFAPEHLEIMINDIKLLEKVKNAGAVFLGEYSVEAAGDYASGPNNIIPTGGFAKVRAGLSVKDFLKTPTVQVLSKEGLRAIKNTIVTLAELESLFGHVNSVKIRFEGEDNDKG